MQSGGSFVEKNKKHHKLLKLLSGNIGREPLAATH